MKVHKQKHNSAMVTAFLASYGIPKPEFEYIFHPTRKWRFDIAWPGHYGGTFLPSKVYLEIDGGIWISGGHNRGAQMKKDWEKRNAATALGWRGLWCEPRDLLTQSMAVAIREALCLG